MSQKTWKRIFNLELIIAIVWMILCSVHPERKFYCIILAILVVILFLTMLAEKSRYIQVTANLLSVLTLPLIFNKTIEGIFCGLNNAFRPLANIFSIIGLLTILVALIPVVKANMPPIKNWILRLVAVEALCFSQLATVAEFSHAPDYITTLQESGVVNALAMFILAFVILKAWGLKFEWNLKFIKTRNFQWWALVILVVLSALFPFFSAFLGLAQTPAQVFNWDFSTFEMTWDGFFAAAEAGIMEETMRYLDIVVLLYIFRSSKAKAIWAVLISAMLFSLGHLTNLGITAFGTYYDLTAVEQQLTYTFGLGMLFAVLYLYTGKLWLNMLIHFSFDFIVFSETPLTRAVEPAFSKWTIAIITLAVPLIVSIFMLLGKRRRFIDDNVDRIMVR